MLRSLITKNFGVGEEKELSRVNAGLKVFNEGGMALGMVKPGEKK